MAQLRINGRVPGKKPVRNPTTVSGFPMYNTFEGLGMTSCTHRLSTRISKPGLSGGNSHVHPARPLDKRNIAHRLRKKEHLRAAGRKQLDECWHYSLTLERTSAEHPHYELMMDRYRRLVRELYLLDVRLVDQLVERETRQSILRGTVCRRRLLETIPAQHALTRPTLVGPSGRK